MPSNEYLQALVERAKQHLPDDLYRSLHRAALPVSGGRASWRGAELSTLETMAIRDIRPRTLRQATDDELSALWARVGQWHRRAGRRKEDQAPFERAAGHLMQEMSRRSMDSPTGQLAELGMAKSTLAARLEELPETIALSHPAVALSHDDLDLYVACGEGWHGEAVIDALGDIGIPAGMDMVEPVARAEDAADLYDLALVRSNAIEKSTGDQLHPPEWLLKQEHNGAMIALMAPPHVREALVAAGLLRSDAPEDLHITLLYLGEAATLSQAMLAGVANVVEAVCREHRPLRVQLSGVGRFDRAVFAIASAVGLSQLQADLERAVSQVIRLPSEHGWVPHLTLGYDEGPLGELSDVKLPAWPAESVRIQVGGQSLAEISLGGEMPGEVAAYEKLARPAPESSEQTMGPKRLWWVKSAAERQVIYYVVSEPGTVDTHGHRISDEDILSALHKYMSGERRLKIEHEKWIDGQAEVVEGFVAPADLDSFHGDTPPDGPILKGTSIVGIHFKDRALWEALSKEDHGLSWGGFAEKVTQ